MGTSRAQQKDNKKNAHNIIYLYNNIYIYTNLGLKKKTKQKILWYNYIVSNG